MVVGIRVSLQSVLDLTNLASREAGEEIVSEEYGRQIRPCWLVVQPQGHQRHGLDDSKAILEAPTKKV
jgi:hypothetical protein